MAFPFGFTTVPFLYTFLNIFETIHKSLYNDVVRSACKKLVKKLYSNSLQKQAVEFPVPFSYTTVLCKCALFKRLSETSGKEKNDEKTILSQLHTNLDFA